MKRLFALALAGALCAGQAFAAPSASLVDETLPGAPPIGHNGKPLPVECVSGCSGGTGSSGGTFNGTVTQGSANDGSTPWFVQLSGTTVFNLSQIGGAAIALGQSTKAGSLPVVLPNDQTVPTADAATAQAVGAAAQQAHTDAQSTSVPTGTKAAPATSGVSLLSVPLPWTSSTAMEACHVFKVGAGTLYRLKMTLGTGTSTQPNGFLKLYDLAATPADGADAPKVIDVVGSNGPTGAQSGSADDDFNFTPMGFNNGLVACFSTTGGFTKTSQATPATFFAAQVQ